MNTHSETSASPQAQPRNAPAAEPGPDAPTAGAAWRKAFQGIGEVRDYAAFLLSAKLDGIKLGVRRLIIFAAMGVLGLLALGALVVTAVVLLCTGIAGAFRELTGHPWLGDLIAFAIVAVVLGGGAWVGLWMITATFRKSTIAKYEHLKHQQRVARGTDVGQRASEVQHG